MRHGLLSSSSGNMSFSGNDIYSVIAFNFVNEQLTALYSSMVFHEFYLSILVSTKEYCDIYGCCSKVTIRQATKYLELELFLRPTVSRPVRLGIGPPFGTLDQMLSCTSFFLYDNYVILISMRPL
jgi:hypothetical protein